MTVAPVSNSTPNASFVSIKTGKSEWLLDQRALNNVLNDMEKVLTDAKLLPYYNKGGKVVGFRASEIKPDGVFSLIGLQNGDILLELSTDKRSLSMPPLPRK